MKIKIIFLTTFFLLSLFTVVNPAQSAGNKTNPLIRVLIIKGDSSLVLSVKGPYKIIDLKTKGLISAGTYLANKKTIASETGIRIKKKDFANISAIKIIPNKDGIIEVNRRRFRGNISIIRNENRTLAVINELGLEPYLYGVLYHEISQKWPMETIRAQAIASRTFALYQMQMNKDKDYDVTSDIYSQMYGGATSEKARTTKAVNMTKGQVLTYKGKIFPAYFHATCGGHTEDAAQLWSIDLEPLKGVVCNFCQESPHLKWEKVISFPEIRDMLKAAGLPAGQAGVEVKEVKSLTISERDASGRVSKIVIATDDKDIIMSGKDFRMLVGPNIIRSTNFTTQTLFDMVQFSGLGWGHGVGLCQWGAYGMGKKGYDLKAIINQYYPGAEISNINETN